MRALSYALLYLAWIISSMLTVLDCIALRMVAGELAALIADTVPMERQAERGWFLYQTLPAVDKFAIAILGLAALASVLAFDYIYRAARKQGVLGKRFGVITAVQVGILAVCGVVVIIGFGRLKLLLV
jgi:hypothetical protein